MCRSVGIGSPSTGVSYGRSAKFPNSCSGRRCRDSSSKKAGRGGGDWLHVDGFDVEGTGILRNEGHSGTRAHVMRVRQLVPLSGR